MKIMIKIECDTSVDPRYEGMTFEQVKRLLEEDGKEMEQCGMKIIKIKDRK